MFYKVTSIQAAWEKAKEIFPSDYQKDESSTKAAGYPIYFSTVDGSNDHISDLGCRLEVNIGPESINIWIEEPHEETELEKAQRKIAELKAALEKEQEWKPSRSTGTNMTQGDYLKLAKAGRKLQDGEVMALLHREFGFDPEKIEIVRSVDTYEVNRHRRLRKDATFQRDPVYDATDWNYIRFNTGDGVWQWEMVNGDILKYYD